MRKRLLSLLLLLLLLPAAVLAETSPLLRVRLKRPALTDRADLWLDSAYLLSAGGTETLFPKGTHLILQTCAGGMTLHAGSLAMLLPESCTLTPAPKTGLPETAAGFRLSKTGNLYPGTLRLQVEGGQLIPTLTLSTEAYLQGVVPYEMSNLFPLEALKAQAICARTYAMAHIDPASAYDVVDTTANQVFRGIDRRNTNAIRAVTDTAGVVGTWKGQLATCYYAASNGGQTKTVNQVWPEPGDWGYYAQADDPYDLENPESPVLRAKIRKDAAPDEALSALILADKKLRATDPASFRITGAALAGIKPPSREASELVLTVSASQTQADGSRKALQNQSVRLKLFPDAVGALKLSIGGLNNELLTLTETADAIVLESRRYGHGVGMSQRGAQWMASQYGKNYVDILAFYYPGMVLMQAPGDLAPAASIPAPLAMTPAPAASPTPRPTLMPVSTPLPAGATLWTVEGIEEDSSLNLRESPSTAGKILMRLYKHQPLAVLQPAEVEGWVLVQTDTAKGYVMQSFLRRADGTAASPAP